MDDNGHGPNLRRVRGATGTDSLDIPTDAKDVTS